MLNFFTLIIFLSLFLSGQSQAQELCRSLFVRQSPPPQADNRNYRKNFTVPKYLIRITRHDKDLLLTDDSFLSTHRSLEIGSRQQQDPLNRTVPMVHPEEVDVIERLFNLYYSPSHYWVLIIDPTKVKNLTNATHPRLPKYGEYFGEVPREAIVDIIPYSKFLAEKPE